MAFRRSTSFRKRPFSRFRSSNRGRLHTPVANRYWQRASFTLDGNAALDGPDNTATLTFKLAGTRAIGDSVTEPGLAMDQALRSINIGGIVMGRIIHPATRDYDAGAIPADNFTLCREHLVVDRLDDAGAAAAINPVYHKSQFPIANASSAASSPDATTEEVEYPMKVLWSNVFRSNLTIYHVTDLPEATGVVLDNGAIRPNTGVLNKRLKARIDDYHGLFYQCSFITLPSFTTSENHSYKVVISGWLYYRLGF